MADTQAPETIAANLQADTGPMDLGMFKAALKGRKLYVWVNVFGDDGEYIKVSHAAFLNSIGADIPFNRDGLSDGTFIDGRICDHAGDRAVFVG